MFQANKFKNIRKNNEMNKDYYPEARGSKYVKPSEDDETGNIEVHLLQRKFDQDLSKKVNRESKNYGKLR